MNGEDDEWIVRWISGCMNGRIVEWAGKWLDGWGEGRMSSRECGRRQTLAHGVREFSSSLSRGSGLALGVTESPSLGRAVLEQHKHCLDPCSPLSSGFGVNHPSVYPVQVLTLGCDLPGGSAPAKPMCNQQILLEEAGNPC